VVSILHVVRREGRREGGREGQKRCMWSSKTFIGERRSAAATAALEQQQQAAAAAMMKQKQHKTLEKKKWYLPRTPSLSSLPPSVFFAEAVRGCMCGRRREEGGRKGGREGGRAMCAFF